MTKKTTITAIIFFCVLAASASAFYFLKSKNKLAEEARSNKIQQEKNYFEINDELAGVAFKIGKKFNRMSAQQLQVKNASFIYGFFAADDKTVACYISQTKREKEGQITVGKLRDGVFEQIKKIHDDAKIDSAEIIEIGESNNKGVKLKMSYTEVDKVPMFQWEVVGITNKTATFAFCELPQAVVELYKDDMNLFLDSVRIK